MKSVDIAQPKDPFASLPVEITEDVLVASEARGAARLSQCSKQLYNIVNRSGDNHIWRSLFLNLFDDPRISALAVADSMHEFDWKAEFQRRIKAWNVIRSTERTNDVWESSMKGPHAEWAHEVIGAYDVCANIIRDISPASTEVERSRNVEWLQSILMSNLNFLWPPLPHEDPDLEELTPALIPTTDKSIGLFLTNSPSRAQLRAHVGVTPSEIAQIPFDNTRLSARAYVYDLRNYKPETFYGPWRMDDANPCSITANWVHVSHLMAVIMGNVDEYRGHLGNMEIDPPMGLENARAYSAPGWAKRPDGDWAGVAGTWRRIVCFMDYNDLDEYNWGDHNHLQPEGVPISLAVFQNVHFAEALRVLAVELTITHIDDASTPGLVDPTRPTIHFSGVSRGGSPNESTLHGHVSVTLNGDIRWHLVSNFGGEDRWQSEGVQVGGVGSALGILGTWSSHEHNERDPAGPFWFWKVG